MSFKWRPSRALGCAILGLAGGLGYAVLVTLVGPPWSGWEFFWIDVLLDSLIGAVAGLSLGALLHFLD
jgi:hypothetical protein